MTAQADVARIAAGIRTETKAVLLADPNDDMPLQAAFDLLALRLIRPVSLDPPQMAWSVIGLAVRAHLQETEHG